MLRKSRKQLTIRFLHRFVLFFTALSACLALFFFFGNAQGFLDATQKMILSVLALAALVTVLLAIILIIMEIVLFVIQRNRLYLLLAAMCAGCLVLCSVLAVLSRAIMLLASGI
jgi:hypothetical protein